MNSLNSILLASSSINQVYESTMLANDIKRTSAELYAWKLGATIPDNIPELVGTDFYIQFIFSNNGGANEVITQKLPSKPSLGEDIYLDGYYLTPNENATIIIQSVSLLYG